MLRTAGQFFAVLLQFGQILKGIGLTKLAGVNQAHEQVSNMGTVLGFVEERVLAVQNRFLQGSFANIIIKWRSSLPQKQRQLLPVILHVGDGLAEMHGLIFAELKKYAETKPGMGSWHVLLKKAGLETKTYLSVREYPDAEVVALVAAASSMSGLPVAAVLEDFGEFIVPDLVKM